MTECRLLEEGDRRHFMTRRFDRDGDGSKLHMQSLAALAHLDFNQPGANSYEQAFQVIRRLGLPREAVEQQFRRMVFNVVARNQDDHVKNIAFLMDRGGDLVPLPRLRRRLRLQPGRAPDLGATRCRSTASATISRSTDLRQHRRPGLAQTWPGGGDPRRGHRCGRGLARARRAPPGWRSAASSGSGGPSARACQRS